MNPVSYALSNIRSHIPREVLKIAFLANINHRMVTPDSIDSRIRELVLHPRIFMDCNLVGGTEMRIPLRLDMREAIDPFTFVYRIPKSLTQGRVITHALNVAIGTGYATGHANGIAPQGSALSDAGMGLMASHSAIPMVSTASVQLVGENTVMVTDNNTLPTSMILRCLVENDENFNHIKPASYHVFAELVLCAVKAYIYVNLQIPMDKAFIHAGAELSRFAEVVDGYSDQNELYKELLDRWAKVSKMQDGETHRRLLRMGLGGQW